MLGEYDKAIADYSPVIESKKYDPNYMWYLYFKRAEAYDKSGIKDKALEDCNMAVSLVETGKSYKNLYDELFVGLKNDFPAGISCWYPLMSGSIKAGRYSGIEIVTSG